MDARPPKTLLPQLELLLSLRPRHVADAIRRVVTDVRPCVMLKSTRVADAPLRGRFVDWLLGRPRPKPVLPPTASKFGGTPYVEVLSDLDGGRFIGQINFEEATRSLTARGFPVPDGMPTKGLLAVDRVPGHFQGRVRWYPNPNDNAAVDPVNPDMVAKYEAKIDFEGGWSMRGLEYFDPIPDSDKELWYFMNEIEIAGVDVDGREGHKLFGHANEALNEHYDFEPAPGRSKSIRDYRLLWRITYDNPAGFALGTNWLYVILHVDDLRASAFQHAIVVGANA